MQNLGEYEVCGMYTKGHLILLVLTIIGILIALKYTKNKDKQKITIIIKSLTMFLWILEIIKIIFNLYVGNASNPNTYIPLYFCSMILYAGLISGFCKGKIKHIGDVFIATGGMIAGIIFLICPNTSLTTYPLFHYISIQSFILHGSMIYLGILINITNYINVKSKDIKYYFGLMIVASIVALIFNLIFDSNLMFISKDFQGTPISWLYSKLGRIYTPFMILAQSIIPFYIVYGIRYILEKYKKNKA